MATEFEIFAFCENETYARQAAYEAFRLADQLEGELSRFLSNSDIGRINRLRAGESTAVGVDAFACLKQCLALSEATGGAFDITVGSVKEERADPRPRELSDFFSVPWKSFRCCIELSEETFEVRVRERVALDLGGYGKGYAVDRMAESLREWEIRAALIHGGRSSVFGFGSPASESGCGWPVTISRPDDRTQVLGRFMLNGRAMGASGVEKGFHILDPRTGERVRNRMAAWVFAPDAATADALSTAFMVMGDGDIRNYCNSRPDIQTLVLSATDESSASNGAVLSIGIQEMNMKTCRGTGKSNVRSTRESLSP